MDLKDLIVEYSTSGPRYTSYPTVPQWSEKVVNQQYRQCLQSDFLGSENNFGLYVHIPFCESRCLYCGCNTQAIIFVEKKTNARITRYFMNKLPLLL